MKKLPGLLWSRLVSTAVAFYWPEEATRAGKWTPAVDGKRCKILCQTTVLSGVLSLAFRGDFVIVAVLRKSMLLKG